MWTFEDCVVTTAEGRRVLSELRKRRAQRQAEEDKPECCSCDETTCTCPPVNRASNLCEIANAVADYLEDRNR